MTRIKASLKLTHTRLPESVTMTQVFFRLELVLADHLTTDKKLSIQDFLNTLWELYSKFWQNGREAADSSGGSCTVNEGKEPRERRQSSESGE